MLPWACLSPQRVRQEQHLGLGNTPRTCCPQKETSEGTSARNCVPAEPGLPVILVDLISKAHGVHDGQLEAHVALLELVAARFQPHAGLVVRGGLALELGVEQRVHQRRLADARLAWAPEMAQASGLGVTALPVPLSLAHSLFLSHIPLGQQWDQARGTWLGKIIPAGTGVFRDSPYLYHGLRTEPGTSLMVASCKFSQLHT